MCSVTYPHLVFPQFVHPAPSTYIIPSSLQVSNQEYTSRFIVKRATAQMVTGPKLLDVLWVWDGTQSSTAESYALNDV